MPATFASVSLHFSPFPDGEQEQHGTADMPAPSNQFFVKKKRPLLICRLFMLMRGEELIGQQIAFFEPDK
jgi:hypothetical protein